MLSGAKERIHRPRIMRFFLWPLVFYLVFLGGYTAYLLFEIKDTTMRELDARLLRAAQKLPSLLAKDFHDRATAAGMISYEEELGNRQRINDFVKGGLLVYAYTLVEKDGVFYFTAPTVTDEEAIQQPSWYFYPYDDAPPEFQTALATGTAQFISYHDEWGQFRSVALPMTSPQGRRYLACVDMKQDVVNRTVLKAQKVAFITGTSFSLMILLFLAAAFKAHKAVVHYSQVMLKENSKLRHEADYDVLTGILNNRSFFRMAQGLYNRKMLQDTSGAVMMLDCDHFKEINDQFGHLAGDKALAFLAGMYQQAFTPETLVGRYGGDEFIVYMPGVTYENARAAALSLIDMVQQTPLMHEGTVLPLSISVGAIWFEQHELSFIELVKKADDALLEVKHSHDGLGLKFDRLRPDA